MQHGTGRLVVVLHQGERGVALQGLAVEFDALLMMRQAHGFAFGKSDMFLLCAAKLDPKANARDASGRPVAVACEKVCPEPSHLLHMYRHAKWWSVRPGHQRLTPWCGKHRTGTSTR